MTPYHPGFRRMLRRHIPQICDKKLNLYEELTALRHQLVQEKHLVPYKKRKQAQPPEMEHHKEIMTRQEKQQKLDVELTEFEKDITEITRQAQKIFEDHSGAYEHSRRLWVARRRVALQQGNFFQVPLTPRHFTKLLAAILEYWWIRFRTFFPLTWNQGKYYFKHLSVARALVIVIMVALLILSWLKLTPEQKSETQSDSSGREQQLQ